MARLQIRPLVFLLTGFGWLVLSSLLGLAIFIGIVRATPLPSWLRLLHVHGALVGGVAQMILGAMLAFIPPLLMTGRERPRSHPFLYLTVNGGALGMLAGFALQRYLIVGIAGLFVAAAFVWLAGDTLKQVRRSLNSPPLNLLFYGLALLALFAGLAVGEGMAFQLLPPPAVAYARLAHIHLNLLGFVVLTIVGTMHNLLPTVLQASLYSAVLARAVFLLLPAGIAVLVAGFFLASLWTEIAGGGMLVVGAALYAYNMLRTWLAAGKPGGAASDHLLVATFFLLLAVIMGVLVTVNYLWDPPAVPFGTLHLVAYTHVALVGFILQTIFGALSHLLPVSLAVARVASNKKRGPYLERLTQIVDRWRAIQIGALSLGTMGLAAVASLTWSLPLGSLTVQAAAWASFSLLLLSFLVFAAKIGYLLGARPAE